MDVDCDGANNTGGKCANDHSGQGTTAFKSEVEQLNAGISDLDANSHPYIVFGNEEDSPSFQPKDHGMVPLSVMANVCNNQVVKHPEFSCDEVSNYCLICSGTVPDHGPGRYLLPG